MEISVKKAVYSCHAGVSTPLSGPAPAMAAWSEGSIRRVHPCMIATWYLRGVAKDGFAKKQRSAACQGWREHGVFWTA